MKRVSLLSSLTLLFGFTLGALAPARAAVTGWSEQTINTSTQGSSSVDAKGVWTIQGSGDLSWTGDSTADSCEFVFKSLTGDGSVTTRLIGPAAIGDNVKIGVMMREDVNDPGAKMISLQRAGSDLGGESYLRAITGERRGKDRKVTTLNLSGSSGNANLFPASQLPIWLKIERRGNGFTPYASTDGAFWIPVGRTQRIPMNGTISAGVFVSADTDGDLQSAAFDGAVTDVSGTLLKPEQAAPLQPNPLIVSGGDNSVTLTWDPVNHLGQPADSYVVYKGKVGDDQLTQLATVPASQVNAAGQLTYTDTTIKNGEIARYRVTTVVMEGGKPVESQTLTNQLYTVSGAPNAGPPIQIGGHLYLANVLDCGGDHELTDKPGSAGADASGKITLTFGGWDIQEEADGGEELLTPVTGDFTFTARVLGVPTHLDGTDADEWAKAGIMVRETPMAESRYVAMLMTPVHGLRSAHRRTFNAGQTYDNGAPDSIDAPTYLRIQRRGSIISVFTSDDGKTFMPEGDVQTVDMTDLLATVYVGFAGTAGGVDRPITQAQFDQVTLATP